MFLVLALLEAPLTIEGKRQRKQVERLAMNAVTPQDRDFVVPKGKGTKLGDIPYSMYK